MRLPTLPLAAMFSSVLLSACAINVDTQGYIEREEKRFTVDGVADLNLTTFDGRIEVRPSFAASPWRSGKRPVPSAGSVSAMQPPLPSGPKVTP